MAATVAVLVLLYWAVRSPEVNVRHGQYEVLYYDVATARYRTQQEQTGGIVTMGFVYRDRFVLLTLLNGWEGSVHKKNGSYVFQIEKGPSKRQREYPPWNVALSSGGKVLTITENGVPRMRWVWKNKLTDAASPLPGSSRP